MCGLQEKYCKKPAVLVEVWTIVMWSTDVLLFYFVIACFGSLILILSETFVVSLFLVFLMNGFVLSL